MQDEAGLRAKPGAVRCSSPPERQSGSRSTFRAAFPNSLRALGSSWSPGASSSGAVQIHASAGARCLNTREGTASQQAAAELNATAATLPKCCCDTNRRRHLGQAALKLEEPLATCCVEQGRLLLAGDRYRLRIWNCTFSFQVGRVQLF